MDQTLERIVTLIGPKRGASKELAEYLGVHPNVITNWKNGRNKSYTRYLPEIAEYFNISMDFLLYGEDHPQNIVENADHSAVSQQNSGNLNINLEGSDLQGLEADLIRVFRSLDLKGKAAVLTTASDEEARMNQQKEK